MTSFRLSHAGATIALVLLGVSAAYAGALPASDAASDHAGRSTIRVAGSGVDGGSARFEPPPTRVCRGVAVPPPPKAKKEPSAAPRLFDQRLWIAGSVFYGCGAPRPGWVEHR